MKTHSPALPSHLRPASLRRFLFGSAYYPEHWDAETRSEDAARMQAAGWNCVRMGDFAWDLFEPREGAYDFSLYDRVIADLRAAGISVILSTPTAAPPAWLTRQHPEILRWNAADVPMEHGSRQHASHLSPVFRDYCRRIVRAMADHFRANPAVIGWQTDNEFHCHFSEDHSPETQKAFREFLRRKYDGDIGKLNAAWGNAFWALTYGGFEEIGTPRPRKPTHQNPAHVLDYRRFLSEAVTRFQGDQTEILREANPAWFLTHNGVFPRIDYRGEFGRQLDFLSYDSYPSFEFDFRKRAESHAANLDYVRAYSGNFVVMEQQSGPGGQADYLQDNPQPGEMRRMTYASIARGGDGILFFRWRNCRFGSEQYWCGVLDHDNVPRRRYQEACQIGREIGLLGDKLAGTSVRADVGIAGADFDALEGHEPLSYGLPSPRKAGEGIHGSFHRRGYAVGFVHPLDVLDGLGIYFIPHFTLVDPRWIPALERYVENGGTLVIGARSGTKDLNGNVIAATPPGELRPLVGASVEEYGKQNRPDLRPLAIRMGKKRLATSLWYEALQPDRGTKVIGTWSGSHLTGAAAVTLRREGKGRVVYVGTYFDDALCAALISALEGFSGFPAVPRWHKAGVESVERVGKRGRLWFFLNHADKPVALSGLPAGTALLSGKRAPKKMMLPANGVHIVEEGQAGVPRRARS